MDKLRRQLKQLYMTCFPEDSKTYAEFFVKNKFDGTNCLTAFDGQKLVTMLYLVKKKMYVRGKVFFTPYLTAGGTLPEYRGRGIFNEFLRQAMIKLRNEGNPITGLMPFDHEFYKLQNFVTHSFYREKTLVRGKLPLKEISFENIPEMKKAYDFFMKDKNCWFYRDEDAFELRLKEIFCEGGKAYGLYDGDNFEGYILTFDDEEVDEYLGIYDDVIDKYDTHFEYVKVNTGPEGEPDNMFRICDCKKLLSEICYPTDVEQEITVCVNDPFLKANSGCFSLSVKEGRASVSDAAEGEISLHIDDLTRLVTGSYDKGSFDGRLEKLLPPSLNCALDKF